MAAQSAATLATWSEVASAKGLDPTSQPDAQSLAAYGFDLAEGLAQPLAGSRAGATMLRLVDALADVNADAELQGYLGLAAAQPMFEELDPAQAAQALERTLALARLPRWLADQLRLERARARIGRQQLAEALSDLAALEAAFVGSALVRNALEFSSQSEASYDQAQRAELESAAYWCAARAECEISLGRPIRADATLSRAERLAELSGHFGARWLAFDLRLRQALALMAWEEVDTHVARASASGLLSQASAVELAQLRLRQAIARHELRWRDDPSDREHLDAIRELVVDASLPASRRASAARFAAGYYAELGDAERAAEALGLAGTDAARERRTSFEAADLDAIEMRLALLGRDPERARAALEQLERSATRFLGDWARVAELSSAVALLQFAQRERVLAELTYGCLAVHGPQAGAHRALEWLHRAQQIGGLARGLGLARDAAALERDVAALVGPRRGFVVFHSGRRESYLFLVDAQSLRCLTIEAGARLRDTAGALANAATAAVRSGAAWDDPRVREIVATLCEQVRFEEWRCWLEALESATVVGDESVGHLPLALLPTTSGAVLGERLALAHAPSIPVAAELVRRARGRGVVASAQFRACLLGAPAAPADVGIDEARLRAWSERLGRTTKLALGREASPTSFASASQGCQLVQIVAHGQYDSQRECRAGFQLYAAELALGAIWSETVERSDAARLTSLAVCGASQHPVLRGDDGRTGLAASFLIAGSDCVLQTPIDLEVEAAVEFFERVSLLVADGASPSEALRVARVSTSKRAPKLQDLLVHAWGAGHQPLVDASSVVAPRANGASQGEDFTLARWLRNRWPSALALAVALAAVGLFVRRRFRRRADERG